MSATSIPSLDAAAARAARERIDQLTKPVGSLGRIEELAERLAAIHGGLPPIYERRAILVGAGDHGVTAEGVSAYPSEVTPQMVGAFLGGFAAINAFARVAKAEVFVANFGVAGDLPTHERLLGAGLGRGTRNFAREAAMDPLDVDRALQAGVQAFETIVERVDPQLIALGEMGIGNTTSAAAVICAITGAAPDDVVGRGTGVDEEGLRRKTGVVSGALARLRSNDWRTVASEVGGFEIVGLAGVLIAAAQRRIPILLDGYIVAAAALLAYGIAPDALGYCIAAHRSRELGHAVALRHLGLVPLLDLDLRLGEGSGAALAMPLCEAAARMVREMKTFAEAGVSTASEPVQV
jgi:nicotinate-nucleotide--dimethylbenzimidazole phosphoribosyltransferase